MSCIVVLPDMEISITMLRVLRLSYLYLQWDPYISSILWYPPDKLYTDWAILLSWCLSLCYSHTYGPPSDVYQNWSFLGIIGELCLYHALSTKFLSWFIPLIVLYCCNDEFRCYHQFGPHFFCLRKQSSKLGLVVSSAIDHAGLTHVCSM